MQPALIARADRQRSLRGAAGCRRCIDAVARSAQAAQAPEGEQTMRGVVGGTKLFNRFTLQKVLGRGGMGIVWLARDERLDRLVALKLVPDSVCFDASAREDLKRETRKSLMLTHPNIVRIFDFIEDERSAAISMEYVDGATLSSMRVKKPSKYFEVDELAPWVTSWCDALTYAHESAKLVHRDLKPSNLMVNSKGELKITDFGIACTLRDSVTYVSVRTSSGTLNYMSPQQLLGEDPAPSDDIYSLGATLYEMLSSKPPFFGGDVASQVREVIAPTLAQRRAKLGINGAPIPKYWEETIANCLAKTPEQRPRTPSDIARRLRLIGPIQLRTEEKAKGMFSTFAELLTKVKVERRIVDLAGAVLVFALAGNLLFNQVEEIRGAHYREAGKTGSACRVRDGETEHCHCRTATLSAQTAASCFQAFPSIRANFRANSKSRTERCRAAINDHANRSQLRNLSRGDCQ